MVVYPFVKEVAETEKKHKQQSRGRDNLFARLCAYLGNPWEAARRAGLGDSSIDEEVCSLLGRAAVRKKIARIEREQEAGENSRTRRLLMRMAEHCPQDGLMLAQNGGSISPGEMRRLDLFGVSSFKCGEKGCEVKFFDRLPALQLLLSLEGGEEAVPATFYQALRESGARLEINEEDAPDGGGDG